MNRQQNRERERVENKLRSWVKSWTTEQKKLFEKMVTNEVNKIEDLTEQVLNESFGVAIKEEFEELTVEEINKILIAANYYMEDYKKIIEESKGDYIEMVKTLEPVIKKEIKAMIKEGKDKLVGIKELRAKHKVPQNELVKMWLEIKEGIGTPKKAANVKGKINNTSKADEKIIETEIPYTVTEKEIEEGQKEKPKENITITLTGTQNNGFKINKIELEKNGRIYIKDNTGIKLEDTLYKSIEEVGKEKGIVTKNLNEEEIKLKKRIEDLNNQLENVGVRREERKTIYAEIEEIFKM